MNRLEHPPGGDATRSSEDETLTPAVTARLVVRSLLDNLIVARQ
jgi:hypothetical protein